MDGDEGMHIFLKKALDDYFATDDILNEQLFNELSLYIYSLDSRNNDLYMLAQLLDADSLQKLIAYYDGDTLRLPSREAYKTSVLTALCFWLKVFKGYNWQEIKQYLDLPDVHKDILSPISIGGKINKIKENLGIELVEKLTAVDEKEFTDFYKELISRREDLIDE